MSEERPFVDGEFYEEIVATAAGWLVFGAAVRINGRTLHLSDLDLRPLHTPQLRVGFVTMLAVRRSLFRHADREGYTGIELEGWRTSGANPNREFRLHGRTRN